VNCYCSSCRRSRAAAFSSTLLVRSEEFRWVRGEARIHRYSLPAPATAMEGGSAGIAGRTSRPTAMEGGSAAGAVCGAGPDVRRVCGRPYATEFCADCGSLVPSTAAGSPMAMLPAGAIDTPLSRLPAVHLYVGSKAPWYEIADAWPQFAELPPTEQLTELFQ
jgi:hypothetical protein